jgi:nudix-type nucleoside diphosphatase (YffH/AdpP family)
MSRKVDVVGKTVLLDDFLKIEDVRLKHEKFDGGMSGEVRRLIVAHSDAVAAVIVNVARQTVILVRQFRYAPYTKGEGWLLETAAGLIDEGESPEAAVRREILEEAGYEVGALERIAHFYATPGYSAERVTLFYAETKGDKPVTAGGGLAAEHEDIEIVELPFTEAFRLLDDGGIVDAKTIIGLMALRRRLGR